MLFVGSFGLGKSPTAEHSPQTGEVVVVPVVVVVFGPVVVTVVVVVVVGLVGSVRGFSGVGIS